jgi:hypothetical protein
MTRNPVTIGVPPPLGMLSLELFLMILNGLELVDLVTLHFLDPHWSNTFDSDNDMRENMFRLPSEIKDPASAE